MKVLVVGAGVIGSFNAARLARAGVDVHLLARGTRLAQLSEHGVVLQDWRTGRRSVTLVPLVERIEPDEPYDVAIVIVRRNQVSSVLPLLTAAPHIPAVVFLGNNLAGSTDMAAALGGGRVLTGMVNAGGQRDGELVRYIWTARLPLLFGEHDGVTRPRTQAIAEMFLDAGLPARVVTDPEAYQKTHAAGLPAFAGALYSAGGDIRQLARRPELLHVFVAGYREALRALQADGTAIKPRLTRTVMWIPERLIAAGLRRGLNTRLAVVGGQAHALAAVDEMHELAEELRAILRRTGVPSPANDRAYASIEAWADAAALPHRSTGDDTGPADVGGRIRARVERGRVGIRRLGLRHAGVRPKRRRGQMHGVGSADCPTFHSVTGRTNHRCKPARGFSVVSSR